MVDLIYIFEFDKQVVDCSLLDILGVVALHIVDVAVIVVVVVAVVVAVAVVVVFAASL